MAREAVDRSRRPRRRLLTLGLAGLLVVAGGTTLGAVGIPGLSAPAGARGLLSPVPGVAVATLLPTSAPLPSPSTPRPSPSTPASHVASSSPSAGPTPTPPAGPVTLDAGGRGLRARLRIALDASRERLAIPGMSVTIIFADGGTWTGTSGLADVGGRVPVTANTAFAIASVSKTYTAALVLSLADEGGIDLDKPALTYLPGAPLDRRITVRQLLNHTSGLYDYFLSPNIDKALLADRDAFWSVKRTLKYVGKPYFPPGRGWHYSNTNYLYLGLLAEKVTGQALAVALRTRLLEPLALDETWYQAVEEPRAPVAHGYRFAGVRRTLPPIDLSDGTPVMPFTSVVSAASGAGSIAGTSGDVARWARLLYTGRVLATATTAEMLDGVTATAGYRPRVPYGLGVQAFPIGSRLAVGHSGRLLGFRSAVRHLPSSGLTIAVLTNQSRADPGPVLEELLGIVLAPPPTCPRCLNPS